MKFASSKPISEQSAHSPIPFEKLVDVHIKKPGRYIGNELGVTRRDWNTAYVRWVLSYPELYEVGSSNLGHIILYSILNNLPRQICDRTYLPDVDLANRLRSKDLPLFAVESKRPLSAFDILGFSLSYELGATNILEMLSLAKLPIYSHHRGNLTLSHPKSCPIIFAGGPTATSNPEPFAPFFDFIALGDGEELLPEISLIISEGKQANLNRLELLKDLSEIPGVYVPSLYKIGDDGINLKPIYINTPKRIKRRVASPIPHYGTGLVPHLETVHDRLTIEIRRGCTRGCRFCQPGMLTRPARDVEPNEIINAVKEGMKKTGYSDFSLLSLSCSDYLSLPAVGVELRNELADKAITLQLPSQRVDRFDDNIAHILGGSRQAGLTFAPEAGTQKLRDIINKGLTDDDLLDGIRKAMINGYKKVKLYFMIGLPGESDEDVIGIAKTCQMLQTKCSDLGLLKLNITISNFTPKPHTPFQWHNVSSKEFERLQILLKKEFKSLQRIKVNFTDVRISAIEDFIGRGDRRLAPVIESAWRAGAGMDSWFESAERAFRSWSIAIKENDLSDNYRDLEIDSWQSLAKLSNSELINFCSKPLPWDHIDTGITKSWLTKELQHSLDQIVVEDCSFDACSNCGVCGSELGHNVVLPAPKVPNQKITKPPNSDRSCKIRICFKKTGSIVFVSHLDLMRILDRSIRRSELPVSYTGGFHPQPRIQIALALPLGVEAHGEWMDIEFTRSIEPQVVLRLLNTNLPKGLTILSAKSIKVKGDSLSQQLIKAIWRFELQMTNKTKINKDKLENAIENIMSSNELIWQDKDKKGRHRERDCRELLEKLVLIDCDGNKLYSENQSIELSAFIDKLGRSIKPEQIKHWIEKEVGHSLLMQGIKRQELILLEC